MPRRPRIILPGTPLHIIQRGNNRQACFFAEEDYEVYLDWLLEYSRKSGCAIHAYVLMTNHVHLLLTPKRKESAGNLMKLLGQRYVQHINRTYTRSGTLWEGRFRSSVIQQNGHFLVCQRYIEMNPVRAGILKNPSKYRWSSYGVNGQGDSSKLITQHLTYKEMGRDDQERQSVYRELFRHELDPGEIDRIRKATNGNFVLGSSHFQEEVETMLGRRVAPGRPGRPKKTDR